MLPQIAILGPFSDIKFNHGLSDIIRHISRFTYSCLCHGYISFMLIYLSPCCHILSSLQFSVAYPSHFPNIQVQLLLALTVEVYKIMSLFMLLTFSTTLSNTYSNCFISFLLQFTSDFDIHFTLLKRHALSLQLFELTSFLVVYWTSSYVLSSLRISTLVVMIFFSFVVQSLLLQTWHSECLLRSSLFVSSHLKIKCRLYFGYSFEDRKC